MKKACRMIIIINICGLTLSMGLFLSSIIINLIKNGQFQNLPNLDELFYKLSNVEPGGIAALGIIILLATPIIGLISNSIQLFREGDNFYTMASLVVIAIIGTAIVLNII